MTTWKAAVAGALTVLVAAGVAGSMPGTATKAQPPPDGDAARILALIRPSGFVGTIQFKHITTWMEDGARRTIVQDGTLRVCGPERVRLDLTTNSALPVRETLCISGGRVWMATTWDSLITICPFPVPPSPDRPRQLDDVATAATTAAMHRGVLCDPPIEDLSRWVVARSVRQGERLTLTLNSVNAPGGVDAGRVVVASHAPASGAAPLLESVDYQRTGLARLFTYDQSSAAPVPVMVEMNGFVAGTRGQSRWIVMAATPCADDDLFRSQFALPDQANAALPQVLGARSFDDALAESVVIW